MCSIISDTIDVHFTDNFVDKAMNFLRVIIRDCKVDSRWLIQLPESISRILSAICTTTVDDLSALRLFRALYLWS